MIFAIAKVLLVFMGLFLLTTFCVVAVMIIREAVRLYREKRKEKEHDT